MQEVYYYFWIKAPFANNLYQVISERGLSNLKYIFPDSLPVLSMYGKIFKNYDLDSYFVKLQYLEYTISYLIYFYGIHS